MDLSKAIVPEAQPRHKTTSKAEATTEDRVVKAAS